MKQNIIRIAAAFLVAFLICLFLLPLGVCVIFFGSAGILLIIVGIEMTLNRMGFPRGFDVRTKASTYLK